MGKSHYSLFALLLAVVALARMSGMVIASGEELTF
jgi:hypothetical protein